MLEPRSVTSRASFPRSVKTQENFPVSTGIVQQRGCGGRKPADEGREQLSERCYRGRKESLAVQFRLQLFLRKPYDKRNKPAIFLCLKFVTEASFVFISSLHSGSKGLFFSPPNYNFSMLRGQERIQFKRKNGGAISVQTGMDNQRAIRLNGGTHTGLLICLKGAAKPQEKGKKGL